MMVGIECVRSAPPRPWDSESRRFPQPHSSNGFDRRDNNGSGPSMSGNSMILPHSAPSSLFNPCGGGLGSRRAASFPLASAMLLSPQVPGGVAAKIPSGNLKVGALGLIIYTNL
uniref:Uncharacterized protein n=1 Tax=Globodera rostochiensis TaxID=31243 RepID=A0A914HEG7_GLORO